MEISRIVRNLERIEVAYGMVMLRRLIKVGREKSKNIILISSPKIPFKFWDQPQILMKPNEGKMHATGRLVFKHLSFDSLGD